MSDAPARATVDVAERPTAATGAGLELLVAILTGPAQLLEPKPPRLNNGGKISQ